MTRHARSSRFEPPPNTIMLSALPEDFPTPADAEVALQIFLAHFAGVVEYMALDPEPIELWEQSIQNAAVRSSLAVRLNETNKRTGRDRKLTEMQLHPKRGEDLRDFSWAYSSFAATVWNVSGWPSFEAVDCGAAATYWLMPSEYEQFLETLRLKGVSTPHAWATAVGGEV